jgi:hypothetical protein
MSFVSFRTRAERKLIVAEATAVPFHAGASGVNGSDGDE